MAKITKLTFKKSPKPTGLGSIGNPHSDTYIKIGKEMIGYIRGPNWMDHRHGNSQWKISIMVNDETSSCGWKCLTFNKGFDTELEAREWVRKVDATIQSYDLHRSELPE
jgi:hypothetical protein